MSQQQAQQTAKQEQGQTRDAQGKFVFGNPGGPGNPYARRVAELRRAMLEAVSAEDIAAILQAMVQKAKEGNVQAARIVLSYTLGKPEKVQDPDRADAHEWEVQKETAAMYDEMDRVMKAPPASLTLGAVRLLRPLVGGLVKEQMADIFLNPGKHFPEMEEGEEEPAGVEDSAARLEPSANGDSAGEAELLERLQKRGVNGVAARR